MDFDRKWFEYLLGVFQGDGCLTYNKYKGRRHPSGMSIAVGNQDHEYADRLLSIITSFCRSLRPRIRCDKVLRVNWYNAEMARIFAQYKSAGLWSVPTSLEFPDYYIAGLWDTDGYVSGSRRNSLVLQVKASGNLEIPRLILQNMGFDRVRIHEKKYTNKLGYFESEGIRISSKKLVTLFGKLIPLQHPRKIKEIQCKVNEFSDVKSKRGHGQMREEICDYVSRNPGSTSIDIAKHLNKPGPTHVTKELVKYLHEGYLSRVRNGKTFTYFLVRHGE